MGDFSKNSPVGADDHCAIVRMRETAMQACIASMLSSSLKQASLKPLFSQQHVYVVPDWVHRRPILY
jgi:hypothetical protein